MPLTTAKILSNPTKRDWTQSYEDNEGLVVLISLQSGVEEDKSAVEVGKRASDFFQKIYSETDASSLLTKLKEARDQTCKEFEKYRISLAACIQSPQNYIYFVRCGQTQIWAIRGGTIYNLTGESFSGKIQDGDVFLLATNVFFESINSDILTNALLKNSPDEIADNLSPLAHRADNPKLGAVIVKPRLNITPAPEPEPAQIAPASVPQQASAWQSNYVRRAVRNLLVKFAQFLPERSFNAKIGGRTSGEENNKKTALSIGIILLIILLVSIFFGIRQKRARDYKASYSDSLARAENLYADALSQKDINRVNAREFFKSAQDLITRLEGEGIKDPQIEKLKQEMAASQTDILGTAQVIPSLFLDLSIFRSGVEARELSLNKDQIAVLDKAGNRVITVGAKSKETKVLGLKDKLSESQSVSVFDGRIYVLGETGIIEIDAKGNSKVVINEDSEWANPIKIAAFGSNIYLLERGGIIWKYPAAASGFGSKQTWLDKSANSPGTALDWVIDGSVFVLSENGEVAKFTRGLKDGFRLSSLPSPIARATAVYTDPDTESLFVLDKEGGRIIEVEKTGNYKLEYVGEDIKNVDDFIVSQSAGKIFLLSQNKLLEIPLKK